MPTGACGINCDVCKLNIDGICSTCGPGTSREGKDKLKVQETLLGQPCSILACAAMNGLNHCMEDCDLFPCENFQTGPYPFSRGFLHMQERRRKQTAGKETSEKKQKLIVPAEHWEELAQKDLNELCRTALTGLNSRTSICLRFLVFDLLIDTADRTIQKKKNNFWEPIDDPVLELLSLVYLIRIKNTPLKQEKVSVHNLQEAHFFQGPHEIETAPLLDRFGKDLLAFRSVAESLGGRPIKHADAAYVFSPFPKILMYYLLWEGDDEFPPRISILYDRSIEDYFAADFIWALTNYVSSILMAS